MIWILLFYGSIKRNFFGIIVAFIALASGIGRLDNKIGFERFQLSDTSCENKIMRRIVVCIIYSISLSYNFYIASLFVIYFKDIYLCIYR